MFCFRFPFSNALLLLANINLLSSVLTLPPVASSALLMLTQNAHCLTLPQLVSAYLLSEVKAKCVAFPASAVCTLDFVQRRNTLSLLSIFYFLYLISTASPGLVNINVLPSLFYTLCSVQTYSYPLSPHPPPVVTLKKHVSSRPTQHDPTFFKIVLSLWYGYPTSFYFKQYVMRCYLTLIFCHAPPTLFCQERTIAEKERKREFEIEGEMKVGVAATVV